MGTTSTSERWTNRRPQEQWPNWSDLPRDIIEHIFRRLDWIGRFRIRAVCKAWSVLNHHVDGLVTLPWAMEFYQHSTIYDFECRLFDPLSGEYVDVPRVMPRTNNEHSFQCECDERESTPLASVYGWVLFRRHCGCTHLLFLYSPFTSEIIVLPRIRLPDDFNAAFSLNETSPGCVIFLFWIGGSTIHVRSCFLGDFSWKAFEFDAPNNHELFAVDVTYANGSFYCLFRKGELGAFNVNDESWIILVQRPLLGADYDRYRYAKLITFDNGDLRLWSPRSSDSKLFKFDSSEMRWVNEHGLDNQVLFIGCTSFSVPPVGRISQLATITFSIPTPGKIRQLHDLLQISTYACLCCSSSSTSSPTCVMKRMCTRGWIGPRKDGLPSRGQSQLYLNRVEATRRRTCWIQLPFGGIWRAHDLLHRPF